MTLTRDRIFEPLAFGEVIRGTPGPDHLVGTDDGQTLAGLRGNDRLESAFTGVTLVGGVGRDRMLSAFTFSSADTRSYDASLDGGVGDDRLTIRLGADDQVIGKTMTLVAAGGDGADRIDVTAAFDAYLGPAASILVLGGDGDDRLSLDFRVEEGTDVASEGAIRLSGGSGNDVIVASVRIDSESSPSAYFEGDGGGGNDVFDVTTHSVANKSNVSGGANIVGGGGNDVITVANEAWGAGLAQVTSILSGGSGDDTLASSIYGDDIEAVDFTQTLTGGGGNDELRAVVTLSYYDASSYDIVNRLDGGTGNDLLVAAIVQPATLGAPASNRAFGGDGNDRIALSGGDANRIETGAGADGVILRPLSTVGQTTLLADFDRNADRFEIVGLSNSGAPGLVDDLDALATFSPSGPAGLRITIGALVLDVAGAPTSADSFADLVANPATQIVAVPDDVFA